MAAITIPHEFPGFHIAFEEPNCTTLRQLNIRPIRVAEGGEQKHFADAGAARDVVRGH